MINIDKTQKDETKIERTITRALNKIGERVEYSKICALDEEGITVNIMYKVLNVGGVE